MAMKRRTAVRRTEYQRKFDLTCRQIEADLQSATQSELNWLFRQVQLKIRRINRFKPTYVGPHQPLQKAYFTNIDLWDKFRSRMHVSILRALVRGYISLAVLTALKWKDLNPINFDSDEYALAVGPELGQRITHVSKTIKKLVGKKIVAWYNTSGMTMQSLVNDLSSSFNFGAYRSSLIAQTELTYLVSAISDLEAAQTGSEKWYWDSRNDQTVCTKEFIGPDGKKYKGCRELHGKIFKQGDKKPPESSHPGCRCRPINLAGPYRKPTLETQTQIIDLPFNKAEWNEQEHPRVPAGHEGGGEFTSKDKPVIAPMILSDEQKLAAASYHNKEYEGALTSNSEIHYHFTNQFLGKDTYHLAISLANYLNIGDSNYDYDSEEEKQTKPQIFGDYQRSENDRHDIKDKTCKILSNKSGVMYEKVEYCLRNWAGTSNDSMESIIAQKAAADIFSIELSKHQKQKYDPVQLAMNCELPEVKEVWKIEYQKWHDETVKSLKNKYEEYRKENIISPTSYIGNVQILDFPDTPYSSKDDSMGNEFKNVLIGQTRQDAIDEFQAHVKDPDWNFDTKLKEMIYGYKFGEPGMVTESDATKIISSMYQHTQKVLADQGFKPDDEITLYRGFTGSKDNRVPEDSLLKEVTVHGNAMESWSMSVYTATKFGDTVLAAKVKVKDIVGTCATGYGCLSEQEVVVKGGLEYPATVIVCPGKIYDEGSIDAMLDTKVNSKIHSKFGMLPDSIPYLKTASNSEKLWILNHADKKQFMNWINTKLLGPEYEDVNTGTGMSLEDAKLSQKIRQALPAKSKWELAVIVRRLSDEQRKKISSLETNLEILEVVRPITSDKKTYNNNLQNALWDKLNALYTLQYPEKFKDYLQEIGNEDMKWLLSEDEDNDKDTRSWIKSMTEGFKAQEAEQLKEYKV
ncbi:MAG: hypothetical protein M0R06_02635 [Sphaerochaeta sp.]|jgi:hypothetical protein|nr:hypothetical protein [Sphaerochaeta sp.]